MAPPPLVVPPLAFINLNETTTFIGDVSSIGPEDDTVLDADG